MKFYVESYGCTMNQGEGGELSRRMAASGHSPQASADDAELVVLNTCTVVETTELRMLRRLRELRSQGKEVVLTGCMAKVQAPSLAAASPESIIVAPQEYPSFSERLRSRYGDGGPPQRPLPPGPAIIPIAQGCRGACSYCITRFARGGLRSVPVEDIEERFLEAIGRGAKEVLLTSQDNGCYGLDIGSDLPSLLDALLKHEGEHRIRLGMMNPEHFLPIADELLQRMEDRRVYRFLHLPLQSGSDPVLKAMGRRYSPRDFIFAVEKAREAFPGISLSTDVIVGFPGETEEDHRASVRLLQQARPDIINVTRFSPRPGTEAASMPGAPHGRVSKARSREMSSLRMSLGEGINKELVGKELDALVSEHGSEGSMICRSDCYRPVVIPTGPGVGERLKLRIVDAAPTHLFGEPAD